MLQEAGGAVLDVYSNQLDFSLGRTLKANKCVMVANPEIIAQVIKAAQQVLEYKYPTKNSPSRGILTSITKLRVPLPKSKQFRKLKFWK